MSNKQEKLQTLMEALGANKQLMDTANQVSEMVLTPMITKRIAELDAMFGLQEDEKEEILKEMNTLKETFFRKFNSLEGKIISHIIDLYDKHFTEGEIESAINFYTSPTGKKLVDLSPVFTREMITFSIELSKRIIEEIEKEEAEEKK